MVRDEYREKGVRMLAERLFEADQLGTISFDFLRNLLQVGLDDCQPETSFQELADDDQ